MTEQGMGHKQGPLKTKENDDLIKDLNIDIQQAQWAARGQTVWTPALTRFESLDSAAQTVRQVMFCLGVGGGAA